MFYYQIADVKIRSCFSLDSFDSFACDACETDVTIEKTNELPPEGTDHKSGTIIH